MPMNLCANYKDLTLKNTFLNSIDPPLDLRREVTCPAFIVPQTPPKAQRQRWADENDSDDESVVTSSTLASATEQPTRPRRVRWADQEDEAARALAPLERRAVTTVRAPEATFTSESPELPAAEEAWTEVKRKQRKAAAPATWAAVDEAAVPVVSPGTTLLAKSAPKRSTAFSPAGPARAPTQPRVKTAVEQPKFLLRTVAAGVEDGEFKAVRVILGKGGSHLKWITEKTGAVLSLRGRGAQAGAREPLHMLIKGTPDQVQEAVQQVEDLFDQVQDDYAAWCRRR